MTDTITPEDEEGNTTTIVFRNDDKDLKESCGTAENGTRVSDVGISSYRPGSVFPRAILFQFVSVWIMHLIHLVCYFTGDRIWRLNPVTYTMKLGDDLTPETSTTATLMNFHAFGGMITTVMVSIQVIATFYFRHDTKSPKPFAFVLHQNLGKIIVVTWPVIATLGMAFHVASKRYQEHRSGSPLYKEVFIVLFLWSVGIGTIYNMIVGIMSVYAKNVGERDLVLHKGSMFFSLFWILTSAFDKILMSVLQLIMNDCGIGHYGILFCGFVGEGIQIFFLVIYIYRSQERNLLYRPFVFWNIFAFITRWIILGVGSIAVLFKNPDDSSCFDLSK